jgi:hypothetical protein
MATDQHRPLPLPADEPMTPTRPGMEPVESDGRSVYWPDGVSTYTIAHHGKKQWQIPDEADTAVVAMDAIQSGGVSPRLMWEGLRDIRRLKDRLAAIEQELLLMAREPVDGRPTMSWRELGESMELHPTKVEELHDRVAAGDFHLYRNWLVENTPRADRYPTA